MTEQDKTPKTARNLNEGGREFGHVHVPSQTQEASQNRGLADDSMREETRKSPPGNREAGAMNRRGNGAQQSSPPGKAARDRRQHKRAA